MNCPNCGGPAVPDASYCHACGTDLTANIGDLTANDVDARLKSLEDWREKHQSYHRRNKMAARLAAVEKVLSSSKVYDVSFWPRAWAIYGHAIAVGLIVAAVAYGVDLLLAVASSVRR